MFALEYDQPLSTGPHYGEDAVPACVFLHRVEQTDERMLRRRLFSRVRGFAEFYCTGSS